MQASDMPNNSSGALSKQNRLSQARPEELAHNERSAMVWAFFALFAALAPFLVILLPRVAGPIMLFGALVFVALFLFSDQKSNFKKNALLLWKNAEESEPVELAIDLRQLEQKRFFIMLEKSLPQFTTRNFIVNQASEGSLEHLKELNVSDSPIKVNSARLVQVKNIDELILVMIGQHRYWCCPWNYQLNFNDEMKTFEENSAD